MGIKLPIGIESYSEICEDNYYYIDKTWLIGELLSQQFKVNLITRPRRFGKTLTMSMLEDFFDISRDSKTHFEGRMISEQTGLCQEWMNQYPVVFISLKNVEGLNFDGACARLRILISETCMKYAYLEHSQNVNPVDKDAFHKLLFKEADHFQLANSLLLLTRMMSDHYGKQTILLIDEYDVPLQKAYENGYYKEMLDVVRAMLSASLKTNAFLKFSVVTGCLKISKESVFTGINNFVANTITVDRFDESIGFTESEVLALLEHTGFADHAEEVRAWYDGFHFGSVDVYCPWDVLNHVASLMENPHAETRLYWRDSGSNEIIYQLFENETIDVKNEFETLLDGGYIKKTITEDLTYDSLDASEENLWSFLFMTGYLTLAREERTTKYPENAEKTSYRIVEKSVALRIPNEEIKEIFKTFVRRWFEHSMKTMDRSVIFDSLWDKNLQKAEEEISDLLFTTISYHDYLESFYHAFVAGVFAGAGYVVETNKEYGEGRPDVVVKDKRRRRVMLFEIKHAKKDETLEHACMTAVKQMHDRKYTEPFKAEGYRTVIGYGIAFKQKDCKIERMTTDD